MEEDDIAARLGRIELMLKALTKRVDAIDDSIHELVINLAATAQVKRESKHHSE
jgi:hypothetical protein